MTGAGGAALDALRDTEVREAEGGDAEVREAEGGEAEGGEADERAVVRAGDEPAVERAGDEDSGNVDANDPGDEDAGEVEMLADT